VPSIPEIHGVRNEIPSHNDVLRFRVDYFRDCFETPLLTVRCLEISFVRVRLHVQSSTAEENDDGICLASLVILSPERTFPRALKIPSYNNKKDTLIYPGRVSLWFIFLKLVEKKRTKRAWFICKTTCRSPSPPSTTIQSLY
jgi:hypothetical protein